MKILQINTVYEKGSTGKIAYGISVTCKKRDIDCVTAYRYKENEDAANAICISSYLDCHVHNRIARYTLNTAGYSYFKTLKFLRWVKNQNFDVLHLHNLHGNFINLKILFKYIKTNNVKVIWTLHDCWAFTGHCAHFDMVGCDEWKSTCKNCKFFKSKVGLFNSQIEKNFNNKKKWLTGVKDLTLVTPSYWLKNLVEQSFLKDYPVKVINNGIDLNIFKPTESDFCEKYGLENKKIVLGVAFDWGEKKGLDVIVELAKTLPEEYKIVLVGIGGETKKLLPGNILSISRTESQEELAKIYSVADVFINPTREDNFPTVNIESIACGTPVITFKTGGSPEIIDETCGIIVDKNDIDGMYNAIINVCENKPFSKEDCLIRAKNYDMNDKFKEYVDLYEKG